MRENKNKIRSEKDVAPHNLLVPGVNLSMSRASLPFMTGSSISHSNDSLSEVSLICFVLFLGAKGAPPEKTKKYSTN